MTHTAIWWLFHILGIDDLSGPWYGFWSGFGSDITEFLILGGVFSIYRRHNCHVKGCWRIGRHPVAGTTYVVCRSHHPHESPRAEDVLREHARHAES